MQKLVFVIPTLTHGGAERVMSNLANQFSCHGYKVTFVLQKKVDDEYPTNPDIKKVYLTFRDIGNYYINLLILLIKMRKAIIKESPDIALSFLDKCNQYFLLSTIGIKRFKRFSSVRNIPELECSTAIKKIVVQLLFPKATGIILQTKDAEKWFAERNIRINSKIIPNQVAEQFFDREFHGERKNIVTVGRLDEQKNQKLLIEAFAKIKNETNENLYIYGEGPLRQELESLVSELGLSGRVFLPGLITDVPETIIGSRLFVLPSDFEGMPNALLEAIALGVPSISTDCPCGGPKEIIENKKNGFLVPVGDVDALAEKMKYVLSLPDNELEAISANAKKSADRYRPENVFKQWEEFLCSTDGKGKV